LLPSVFIYDLSIIVAYDLNKSDGSSQTIFFFSDFGYDIVGLFVLINYFQMFFYDSFAILA
jgi:hypothetical protein